MKSKWVRGVTESANGWSCKGTRPGAREFKVGDVIWMEAQTHIGENIGETNTHALIIEFRESAKI